jgi:phage-related baseplate assembly protein
MVKSAKRSVTVQMELSVIPMTEHVTAKKATVVINAKVHALLIDTATAALKFVAAKTEANVITYQANATVRQDLLAHC